MRAVWKKLSRPSVTRCRWHTQQRCFTDSAAGTSVVAAASTPAASDAIPSSAAPSTAAAAESVIAGTLASDPKVCVTCQPIYKQDRSVDAQMFLCSA